MAVEDAKTRLLWLLPRPLKLRPDGDIAKLILVLAERCDELRTGAMTVRLQASAVTSTAAGQRLVGKDRDMPRLPRESEDGYRRRLVSAFRLYERGGTVAGMTLAMRTLGLTDVEILEGPMGHRHDGVYRYGGEIQYGRRLQWAEFAIRATLPEDLEFDADMWTAFLRSVAKWKAGHTRWRWLTIAWTGADNTSVTEEMTTLTTHSVAFVDGVPTTLRYDGRRTYSGAVAHAGELGNLEVAT